MSISLGNATELNEQVFYKGEIKNAYNQNDLPILPGNWKVYDLEKSGSVPSGNFYVYATLVPEEVGPTDNAFNFDGINYAVLGSKSEETSYRKSFYACDAGWITDADVTTSNIDSRGSGNFEETCSVIGEINPFYTIFFYPITIIFNRNYYRFFFFSRIKDNLRAYWRIFNRII